MKLRFEVTLDDGVAFVRHYYESTPALRRQRLIVRCLLSLSIVVVVALVLRTTVAAAFGALAGAIYFFRMPALQRRSCERAARRMYGEGDGRGLIGMRELELTEGALIERWDGGETRVNYEHIHKVESTPDYLLIYPNAISAHIIPRRVVAPSDLSSFSQALEMAVTRALANTHATASA